jgi:hypothetical protein
MKASRNKVLIPESDRVRSNARAAAAFGVIAVRRGLPLESVDIIPAIASFKRSPEEDFQTAISDGCATLVDGAGEAWVDALPDPEAVARLTDMATMAAGLCISEGKEGRTAGDGDRQQSAAYRMFLIAQVLEHNDKEERKQWIIQRVIDALTILAHDGEAAWNRVRTELETKQHLTGDEVRALVAESDAQLGSAPTRSESV